MIFESVFENQFLPIQSCARVSDWPISIWVYIFPSVEFSIYVLTF